jgi:hypothetical protein
MSTPEEPGSRRRRGLASQLSTALVQIQLWTNADEAAMKDLGSYASANLLLEIAIVLAMRSSHIIYLSA